MSLPVNITEELAETTAENQEIIINNNIDGEDEHISDTAYSDTDDADYHVLKKNLQIEFIYQLHLTPTHLILQHRLVLLLHRLVVKITMNNVRVVITIILTVSCK